MRKPEISCLRSHREGEIVIVRTGGIRPSSSEPHSGPPLSINVPKFSNGWLLLKSKEMSGPDKADCYRRRKSISFRDFPVRSFAKVTRRAGECSHDVTPGSPHPRMQEDLNKSDCRQEIRQALPQALCFLSLVDAISCPVAKRPNWVGKASSHIFQTYLQNQLYLLPPGVQLS